eukprot:7093494-Prymnesium_polylepis.1
MTKCKPKATTDMDKGQRSKHNWSVSAVRSKHKGQSRQPKGNASRLRSRLRDSAAKTAVTGRGPQLVAQHTTDKPTTQLRLRTGKIVDLSHPSGSQTHHSTARSLCLGQRNTACI